MTLELLPAIDIVDGQAVRLVQGELGTETDYGSPVAAAQQWQNDGAEWIHLVDLDAAFGKGNNSALAAEIVASVDIKVELSGGIRDDESLAKALATGCRRVNLGTAAIENPDWCRKVLGEFGDRIAIGVDVRGTTVATRGWTQDAGDVWALLDRLQADGCQRYVVTDVTRDGMLTGPNLELLAEVAAYTGKPVVASGGIANLDDLRALATMTDRGIEGAIIGKALYSGAFTLPEALAAVAQS